MGLLYFYPRSPCGERQPAPTGNDKHSIFLSTLSLRRATSGLRYTRRHDAISIHALLAESDRKDQHQACPQYQFLSTLSLRRATSQTRTTAQTTKFLSTLSLRRATNERDKRHPHHEISIHALLAESDSAFDVLTVSALPISIHALLAESDVIYMDGYKIVYISIHALLAESDRPMLCPLHHQ